VADEMGILRTDVEIESLLKEGIDVFFAMFSWTRGPSSRGLRPGIQNGGVDRMSGMSSILDIHPGRPELLAQRAE